MSSARDAISVTARYLDRNSDKLVESWIDWVKSRVQTGTPAALPDRALRNHVPPIVKSLARYVRNPIEFARQELLANLQLHGQVRRDQGYSLQEVLAEFEGLADLVTRAVLRILGDEDRPTDGSLEAMKRLATGLRSVSFIAMATFSRSDQERRDAIASSMEEFARAACHELRNPLNAIALSAHALKRQFDGDEYFAEHLQVIQDSVRHSDHLLDTIHVLAVAESARTGQMMVLLDDAVSQVVQELARQSAAAEVEVRVERPLPEVRVESVLLYLVLANAIGNFIKYSDRGKEQRWGSISAKIIEEEHDSGFCELRFEDNGIGIPEEFVPRVFQKKFRAHPDHAHGTGLGLYILQQTVTSRGGEVAIESEEGKGTALTVRVRCLHEATGALTADQYRVEALMGESVWNEIPGGPDLPDDEETD